jgi:hypothetical protein
VAGRSEENDKAELELELMAAQIAAQINHPEQRRSQIEEAVATLREAASVGNAAKQRKTLNDPTLRACCAQSEKRFAPGRTIKLESRKYSEKVDRLFRSEHAPTR